MKLRRQDPVHDHAHDWRVDPGVIFPSHPPRQRLVCAYCLAETSRLAPDLVLRFSRDPSTWPKAE